jgi:putative glutamine amidotransferase
MYSVIIRSIEIIVFIKNKKLEWDKMQIIDIKDYPIVGISANVSDEKFGIQNINEKYMNSLFNAECLSLIIPIPDILHKGSYPTIAERIIDKIDGLLLSGGDDINAKLYHEDNLPFNGKISEERDLFEIELCQCAARQKKPILGICRGIQLINVAMGGTVFQDIMKQNKDLLMHVQNAQPHFCVHDVEIVPNSLIADVLFSPEEQRKNDEITDVALSVGVNSFHHQAVKNVAPGFFASGLARDGIIEVIEPDDRNDAMHRFTIGIQWHPERMTLHHRSAQRLFARFSKACKERMHSEPPHV